MNPERSPAAAHLIQMLWRFNLAGLVPTTPQLQQNVRHATLTRIQKNPAHPTQSSSKPAQLTLYKSTAQHHAPVIVSRLAPAPRWSRNTLTSSRQSGLSTLWTENHILPARSPTWTEPGFLSKTLQLILPLGKTFWDPILTKIDSSRPSNLVGTCPFYLILTHGMLPRIISLLMIILTLSNNIYKKSYLTAPLSALFLKIYLSSYPGLRWQLSRSLDAQTRGGASPTVHNDVTGNYTASTTGFQLSITEEKSTKYIYQEYKRLSDVSSFAKRSIPAPASSCLSMIFLVFIASCTSTQAKLYTSSSSGMETFTLTGSSPSAIVGHVWRHNQLPRLSVGCTGRSFNLPQTDPTPGWPATVKVHVYVATISLALTSMIAFASAPKNTANFCLKSLVRWPLLSLSSYLKLQDIYAHPVHSARHSVSYSTSTLTQYLCQPINLSKLLTWSILGCRKERPCGRIWTLSVASFYTQLGWCHLDDYTWPECLRQNAVQTRALDPWCWTTTSTSTLNGGTAAWPAGTGLPTYSSSTTATSQLTPAAEVGTTPNPALEDLIIPTTPSLPRASLALWRTGTSATWSSWPSSSPTGCGETPGSAEEWVCSPTTRPQDCSLTTASHGRHYGCKWVASSHRFSSKSIFESRLIEYRPLTINLLITYLGRVSQGWLILLKALSTVLEYRLLDCRSLTACSPFNSRPAAQDMVQHEVRRLQLTARPSAQPQPTSMSTALLRAAAQHIQEQDRADSTKIAQNSRVKTYFQFAKIFNISQFPPDGEQVVLYATWLALTTISTSDSLRQYLSSLKTFCTRQGMFCPSPTQYPPLQATIDGMARIYAAPSRRSLPITPQILIQLIRTAPPTYPYNSWMSLTILKVFKAACILLYFTMLRSSNLMPASPGAACKIRQLTWDKIDKTEDGVVITMVLEKTIQYRQRLHRIPLKADPDNEFCPVRCLQDLVDMRGKQNIKPDDHVLQLPDGQGGWSPLCKYQLNKWLKHRLQELGLPADRYFIHGFRHGSLSEALSLEPNLTLVRLTSNHLSNAIFTYSNVQPERRYQVSSKMLDSITAIAATLGQRP